MIPTPKLLAQVVDMLSDINMEDRDTKGDVDALSEANTGFEEHATVVLVNPPFKGSLDREAVDPKILRITDSKKTVLLFLALILKGLKLDGRAAVIVPDGVLFGSGKAHGQIRFVNTLIDYLTANGTIEKSTLFEPPFTDVFSNEQVTQIVRLVEKVNGNAVAV